MAGWSEILQKIGSSRGEPGHHSGKIRCCGEIEHDKAEMLIIEKTRQKWTNASEMVRDDIHYTCVHTVAEIGRWFKDGNV